MLMVCNMLMVVICVCVEGFVGGLLWWFFCVCDMLLLVFILVLFIEVIMVEFDK